MSEASIRRLLGNFIGQTVVDITQHDVEDWLAGGDPYVQIQFGNGEFLQFPTNKPFCYSQDGQELEVKVREMSDGISEGK
jgi:hypothetical protein